MIFNFFLLARIFVTSVLKDPTLRTWASNNHAILAATSVLALTNIGSFSLLHLNLFYREGFNAHFGEKMKHQLMIGGLMGNVLEDIPQLVIQALAASNSLDPITLLSIVASVLTISSVIIKHLIFFLVAKYQGKSVGGYQ